MYILIYEFELKYLKHKEKSLIVRDTIEGCLKYINRILQENDTVNEKFRLYELGNKVAIDYDIVDINRIKTKTTVREKE